MHDKFEEMAEKVLKEAISVIPSDPMLKFIIFTETTRVLDFWYVFQHLLPKENRLPVPDFDLIKWGWNLAAEHLFSGVKQYGFPIMESSSERKSFAFGFLYKLGCSVLLHRASEMIRYGFLEVETNKNGFILRRSGNAGDQFLDNLDIFSLNEIETILNNKETESVNGWHLFDIDDYPKMMNVPGAFSSRGNKKPLESFKVENIDELMEPLVRPWDSGFGIMMGYGALPEVDDHFIAEAAELVLDYRNEAGVHPDVKIGKISGAELTLIITVIIALHSKHIRFALLAMKKHPEISIPDSLTIWGPVEELIDSITHYVESFMGYSKLSRETISCALDVISLKPGDVSNLHKFTTPFVPLLISLGNGFILRPVSSLNRNPFLSTMTLQEWRDPKIIHRVSSPREDWLRNELYAIFHGSRYIRVEGNIKIRSENKILTDIDAAVFDVLTGELALFQIKWQDYFTNDVRKLRSKAGNLTKELDEWAEKVETWIEDKGKNELIKALRLKLPKGMSVSSIYLFGISRNLARIGAYGFNLRNKNLAIANWAQFRRIRHETGPTDRVFHQIFNTLREEMNKTAVSQPLPVTIEVSEKSITFEDIWNAFDTDDGGEDV
jgi:hypothetical protein